MSKRIRTIKPALWEDAKLGRLDAVARLTYVGLICMANDYGKFRADAEGVKAYVHARDHSVTVQQVEASLEHLASKGLIELYGDEDEWFGRFPEDKWRRHQIINRPGRDELPDPSKKYPKRRGFTTLSVSVHGTFSEPSLTEEEREEERKGENSRIRESGPPAHLVDDVLDTFDELRKQRAGSRQLKRDAARRKVVRDRLKDGYTPDELQQAARTALAKPWPWDTGNANPEHVYRRANLERYLELATASSQPVGSSLDSMPELPG
jgi:hypothetical protein